MVGAQRVKLSDVSSPQINGTGCWWWQFQERLTSRDWRTPASGPGARFWMSAWDCIAVAWIRIRLCEAAPTARIQGVCMIQRRWTQVVLMLGHRLRQWPNIKTTLCQRILFTGVVHEEVSLTDRPSYLPRIWTASTVTLFKRVLVRFNH